MSVCVVVFCLSITDLNNSVGFLQGEVFWFFWLVGLGRGFGSLCFFVLGFFPPQ